MEGTRAAGRAPFIRERPLNPRTIWYGRITQQAHPTTSASQPKAMRSAAATTGKARCRGAAQASRSDLSRRVERRAEQNPCADQRTGCQHRGRQHTTASPAGCLRRRCGRWAPNLSQRKPSASAHPVHVKRIGKARKRDSMQNLSTTAQRIHCGTMQQTESLPHIPSFLWCRMRQLTLSIARVHRDMFDQYQVANEVERSFV